MKAALGALAIAAMLAGCGVETPAPTPPASGGNVAPEAPGNPAGTESQPAAVPEEYRGNWAADADACTTPGAVSRLQIQGSRIRFHESEGPVVSLVERGRRLTVLARLTGEGETRDASYTFTLSADGETLTDRHGFARQRCR